MGSYLSIYNNTEDTYHVKIGPDMAAVNIAGIVASVLTGVVGGVRILSSKLVANGVVRIFGVTASRMAAITNAAAKIAGRAIPATAAGWAMAVSVFVAKQLEDEGYVKIPPGEKHVYGPYSLSLWQQATCRRVRENGAEVVTDVVYMRPIFSGATVDSVREHNIQYWIDKWGHEERFVIQSDMKIT